MRCRKRGPKRSMACRMRGTSAMSIPVPTIMFEIPLPRILQQTIATINQAAIEDASLRHQHMRFDRTFRIDVQDLVSVSDEPVGHQHTVAAKIEALRAHVGGGRVCRELEQVG